MDDAWKRQWEQMMSPENLGRRLRAPPEAEVIGVQFGLLSAEEIAKLSAVEVKQPTTQKTGVVQRDGVTDSRLGTSQRAMLCGTCGCDHEMCAAGHSGHIRLAQPVPNGEFLAILHKILESVCCNCCQLRIPKDFPTYKDVAGIRKDKERIKRIHVICRRRLICETSRDTKRRRKIISRSRRRKITYEEASAQLKEEEDEARRKGLPVEDDVDMSNMTAEEILAMGQGCGTVNPSWIRDEGIILRPVYTLTEDDKRRWQAKDPTWHAPVFTPNDMHHMLSNISDETIAILGMNPKFSRPSSLLWKNFYVPTVNIRPSKIGRSGNNRCPNEDDLTLRLKAIERANCQLTARLKGDDKGGGGGAHLVVNIAKYKFAGREFNTPDEAFTWAGADPAAAPAPPLTAAAKRLQAKQQTDTVYALYDRLYRSITTYQNNKLKGKNVACYGKEKKSIRCRFHGRKKNRVCGTVTGKRMSFTARTVVTPNPTMHIRQVGVPRWICSHLTYPEMVNPYNVHRLTSMVRNGPKIYPGARYMFHIDGRMVDLDGEERHSIELATGMIVERHLIDGDYVIMNRQPTLHKPSMMAHRIMVIHADVNTFELHLAVTPAFK